jgi:hypothetical protein
LAVPGSSLAAEVGVRLPGLAAEVGVQLPGLAAEAGAGGTRRSWAEAVVGGTRRSRKGAEAAANACRLWAEAEVGVRLPDLAAAVER